MPKIREYEQRTSISVPGSRRVSESDFGTGAGYRALGEGISSVGAAATDIYERQEMQKAELIAAQARADRYTALDEQKKTAKEDGSGFTQKFNSDYNQWKETQVSQVSSSRAQQYLSNKLTSLQGDLTDDAIRFQSGRMGQYTKQTFEKVAITNANSVRANPNRLDGFIESEAELIRSNQYLRESGTAESYAEERRRALHDSALDGYVSNLQANDATTPSQVDALLKQVRDPKGRWIEGANRPNYDKAVTDLERLRDSLKTRQTAFQLLEFNDEKQRIIDNGLSADKGRFTESWLKTNVPDPMMAARMVEEMREARAYGAQVDFVRGKPETEVIQKLTEMRSSTPGADDYGTAASAFKALSSAYAARMKAWVDDPVGATMKDSPLLQSKYEAAARDPSAYKDYLVTLEAEQRKLYPGRPTFVVSKAESDRIKQALDAVGTDPTGADKAVATLQLEAQKFGGAWPKAVAELRSNKAINASQYVVGNMVQENRSLALTVMKASKIPDDEISKRLPSPAAKQEAMTNAAQAVAKLKATLSHTANGVEVSSAYEDTIARTMLYEKYLTGNNDSPDAKDYFNGMIGNEFTFRDTYRIPSKFNADSIDETLAQTKRGLLATPIYVPPNKAGLNERDAEASYKASLREYSRWVNTDEGDGVRLIADNGEQVYRNVGGKPVPVRFKFQELSIRPPRFDTIGPKR